MTVFHREFSVVALGAATLLAGFGCAAETQQTAQEVVVTGTAQKLSAAPGASLRVAARWSTELAPNPGVFIQIEDVGKAGGSDPGAFDLQVVAPPTDALDQGDSLDQDDDADYSYSSAELVLLDDDTLANGWMDAQQLNDREVGRAPYVILWVDRDMPATAEGHFGIGRVDAGFHLIERQPDKGISLGDGVSGTIAVWKELPLDAPIDIAVGSDGSPTDG